VDSEPFYCLDNVEVRYLPLCLLIFNAQIR